MGKTKHEKSYVDFEQPYERNIIGLRGIIYFGVGLFLLVVITFGLMWVLLDVMNTEAAKADEANRNPMMMSERDRLPPEPRLQSAPGFGVGNGDSRINLELRNPQAEWEVLQKQYKEIWEKGQTAENGTVVALPIDAAKERFLQHREKSRYAEPQENILEQSQMIVTDSSAGRRATEKRR